MVMNNLKICFESAINKESEFIGVAVSVKDAAPEIIINSKENFKDKLAYYENAYNEDLSLKAVPYIKITGFTFGNSFEEIQKDLIG